MPPSRKILIGPMRTQSSPTPVGPPSSSLPGRSSNRLATSSRVPLGLKLRGDVDAHGQFAGLVQLAVQVEVAAAGRCGRRCW